MPFLDGLRRRLHVLLRGAAPGWVQAGEGLQQRGYRDYEDYVRHQRAKLGAIGDLSGYDSRFRAALGERLRALGLIAPGMRVLCLGARLGTEVKAFRDLGCFAVGVDLNPGAENAFVLYGDFHAIQFPTGSAELTFTNSLDHVLDVERVLGEVHRVLRPEGLFIVEAVRGRAEGQTPGLYESFFWSTIDDLAALLQRHRFTLLVRQPFSVPWAGEHLCLRKEG